MSNIPANIKPARPPAEQSRLGADLVAMYLNRLETTAAGHYSISEDRMPVGTDRLALQSRRDELAAGMSNSEPRAIVERVARLFMRFPASRLPDEIAGQTLSAYAQDLASFPLWAIDKAFMSVIAGQAGTSKTFIPSSVELRVACEKAMKPVQEELSDITKVLNAEVYREPSPEEKAKVSAQFRELVEELKLNVDPRDAMGKPKRPPTKVEAQEWLDNETANPRPWPQFSPALRKVLGLPDQQVSQMDQEEGRAA